MKNLQLRKRLFTIGLATTLLGVSGYSIKEHQEYKRIEQYITDLKTEQNYVDLTKISNTYPLAEIDCSLLKRVLKEKAISYVKINDVYLCDETLLDNLPFFTYYDACNTTILGMDDNNNPVYEAVRVCVTNENGSLTYIVPEGYSLREVTERKENVNTVSYDTLDNYEIETLEEENTYRLFLKRK